MIEARAITNEELWGNSTQAIAGEELGPVMVSHVVDFYNRYSGEKITFFTRLDLRESLSDLTLSISLPRELVLNDYRAPSELKGLIPTIEVDQEGNHLVWLLAGELPAGTRYEFQTEAVLVATGEDIKLEGRAVVLASNRITLAEESVTIAVRSRGSYLRHLPAIYEQDELMGRFLMLFESFWAPIETQLDNIHYYFDPRVTPAAFLPWLASWLGLELVDGWPQEGLRQLIRWAIALHRSRGTKWGLLKYLEIYTGQQAEIIERRAQNFVLGPAARLGPGTALGQGNRPHTFTVKLWLPPIETEVEAEQIRQEKMRQRTIEAIIDRQKPAHTVYQLELNTLSSSKLAAQTDEKKERADEAAVDEIAARADIWFKLEDEPAGPEHKSGPKTGKSSKRKGRKT